MPIELDSNTMFAASASDAESQLHDGRTENDGTSNFASGVHKTGFNWREFHDPSVNIEQKQEKESIKSSNTPSTAEGETPFTQPLLDSAPVWKLYLQQAKSHDDELGKIQNSDLDSLLIFAGLFSAILSAFLIEIRKGLQEDLQSITNDLLHAIIDRMDNISATSKDVPVSSFHPTSSSIWVNALWFLSLTLSLVSAFGTILAKGWIAQYTTISTSGVPVNDACLRHRRFIGATQWHLKTIINSLPILIHGAFFFFFVGLVVLLAQDDIGIQNIVLALVISTALFYIASTFLPIIYLDCPFQTPLSGFITRFLSICKVISHSTTNNHNPVSDSVMANALAWLLLNSNHKDAIWMTVEAIASLPTTAEVQLGLSRENVAGTLAHGLSECIKDLRSQNSTSVVDLHLHHYVETYLFAILHLIQSGSFGSSTAKTLRSLVQSGGPLSQWRDLGPGISEIALCVKARITLLHLHHNASKEIFDMDVPIMSRAVSHPQVKQMLDEIMVLRHNSKLDSVSQVRDDPGSFVNKLHPWTLQLLQRNRLESKADMSEVLSFMSHKESKDTGITKISSVRTLIDNIHTKDLQMQWKIRVSLRKYIQNDELRHVVLDGNGIEMILHMNSEGPSYLGTKHMWRELVAIMVQYEDIRAHIIKSTLLFTFINNLKDSNFDIQSDALELLLELVKYYDARELIMNTDAIITITSWFNSGNPKLQKAVEAIAEFAKYDELKSQIISSNTAVMIINTLASQYSHLQSSDLRYILDILEFDEIRSQIIKSEVLVPLIHGIYSNDLHIQKAGIETIVALSKFGKDEITMTDLIGQK